MKLLDYLTQAPGSQAALARTLGLSIAQVWQWKEGIRPVPPIYAKRIESATDGQIRCWDLRPTDWHDIWPELVTAEGAPPIQERPANLPSGEPQKVGRKGRAANDPVAVERVAQEG